MAIDYFEDWVEFEGERDLQQAQIPPRLDLLKSKDGNVRAEEAGRICILHYGVGKKAPDDLTRIIVEYCLLDTQYNGHHAMSSFSELRNPLIFRPLLKIITDAIEDLDYTNKNILLAKMALRNFEFYPFQSNPFDPYINGIKEDAISICSKIINQKYVKLPEIKTPKRKDGKPDLRYKHADSYIWFEKSQKSLKSAAKRAREMIEKWE